jgi:hypothetical protein
MISVESVRASSSYTGNDSIGCGKSGFLCIMIAGCLFASRQS